MIRKIARLIRNQPGASVAGSGWGDLIPPPQSKLDFLGNDALEKMVLDYEFKTVLDLGCGNGDHTRYLKSHGKEVSTLDAGHYHDFKPDHIGNYEDINFGKQFDAIWSSHVLEHVFNMQSFLQKLHSDLKVGGILAITVPPLKHAVVSGHINLFNTGILVYHLVMAGFDCSKASVKVYGYNISVIVQKTENGPVSGTWSLPRIAQYFPFDVKQSMDGRIICVNWQDLS